MLVDIWLSYGVYPRFTQEIKMIHIPLMMTCENKAE